MFGLGKSRKNDIKPSDAHELMNNLSELEFVILDVRSPGEYSEEHIARAENIDYMSKIFKSEIDKRDRNKKYLVYCRSGHRSSDAVKIMIELGFTDIHNISGGINKWKGEGLPIV
ncbi:rhodanese-like domain-containing protein [Methanobacterium sp.]|uniref:rhodanese-like domain-containing protein n=2 Tax=Methanobacterium sp. TaxID=2164 RepID=UPI003C775028